MLTLLAVLYFETNCGRFFYIQKPLKTLKVQMHKYETDDTEIPNAKSLKERRLVCKGYMCVFAYEGIVACENTGVPIHIHLKLLV